MTQPTDPGDPAFYSGYAEPDTVVPPPPQTPHPPGAPAYGTPAPPAYGTPAPPAYGTPAPPVYGAPAPPVYGSPAPAAYGAPAAPGGVGAVLLVIGDMSVTQTHVITPRGTFPLDGSTWQVADSTTATQGTPQWATIMAIVGFFFVCFLSLLFLLVKETQYGGAVHVTAQGPGWSHTAALAPGTGLHVQSQVDYVRNLVAALPV